MNAAERKSTLHPFIRAAVQQGNADRLIEYLSAGGDVNARDPRGRTPLMFASLNGHQEMCQLLLERGADKSMVDESGKCAIVLASASGQSAAAELIKSFALLPTTACNEEQASEIESEFFEDWLPEEEVRAVVDNDELRTRVEQTQETIWNCRAQSDDADWGDIEINLPESSGLEIMQEFQREVARSMLATLVGDAKHYGFFDVERIEAISCEIDGIPKDDTRRHILQLMGDLAVIQEQDGEWRPHPMIDEDIEVDVDIDEYCRYMQDLSSATNDPYVQHRKDVSRSVLLDREGEGRIGELISLALDDACRAISTDENLATIVLELETDIAADAFLLSRLSRVSIEELDEIDDSEDSELEEAEQGEDGSVSPLSRKFQSLLGVLRDTLNEEESRSSKERVLRAVKSLDLTVFGMKFVNSKLEKRGKSNPLFASAIERGKRLEHELFMANLKLAISVAVKYTWTQMPQMDRIQEAYLGLLKAVERFDFGKGFKFSTYATWWLKQGVTRAVADKNRLIRLPVHMLEKVNKLARIARHSGFDSPEEIPLPRLAKLADYSEQEIVKALSVVDDATYWEDSPGDQDLIMALVDQSEDPFAYAERLEMEQIVRTSIDNLPKREPDVIRHRFGLGDGVDRTLEEVGQMFNVTRERIRQIEKKALDHLRHSQSGMAALKGYIGSGES